MEASTINKTTQHDSTRISQTVWEITKSRIGQKGAGPGDRDYNGGRWLPTMVSCTDGPCGPFTDGDDVEAALENGTLQVDDTGTPFLCPLTNPNDEA